MTSKMGVLPSYFCQLGKQQDLINIQLNFVKEQE